MTGIASGTIAVIGLGSMGLGMASSLARGGAPVSGFDISPRALEELAKFGRPSSSPAEATRGATALISVVVNAAQTREILFGEKGAQATLTPGSLVMSCATMSPQDARDIGKACIERGWLYLDAPISGGGP